MSTAYKPSPLSYGSPRASPFRRPESPASPSPLRQSTPNPSPSKMSAAVSNTTPTRLAQISTPPTEIKDPEAWTPRGLASLAKNSTPTERNNTETGSGTPRGLASSRRKRDPSPTPIRGAQSPGFGGMLTNRNTADPSTALSKLQPAQVRELREGFQILDRDSDGQVGREDVADMLTQLGMPANASDITAFFPPSTSQTISLPTFLNSVAGLLASLSQSEEMLSAFSAFDEDDSGQVDLAELRDALLHTAPESGEIPLTEREIDKVMSGFTSRKAFGKNRGGGMGKRGDVFQYQKFVSSVAGGPITEEKKGDE